MNQTMQNLRGTGRTTRMLAHAKKMASEGREVYVIAGDSREARRLEGLIDAPALGIKVMPALNAVEWERLTVIGASPDSMVLCDHHAIETRYARQLAMLHAYDAPAVNDTALLNWLEENNGRLQFEAEDEATPPHAVVYLPTLEDGKSQWREAGRGDDFRAAIADAMAHERTHKAADRTPMAENSWAKATEMHHHWRVRKRYPDGMFGCCEYNSPVPVSASTVAHAPSVQRWLDGCQIDEIYHPERHE